MRALERVHAEQRQHQLANGGNSHSVSFAARPGGLTPNASTLDVPLMAMEISTADRGPTVFAIVDGVAPDSPAAEAGLKRGDRILAIGDVRVVVPVANGDNKVLSPNGTVDATIPEGSLPTEEPVVLTPFQRLPAYIAANEGVPIEVTVLRRRGGDTDIVNVESAATTAVDTLTLRLTPQKWSGRGLLGCHIVPVESGTVPGAATSNASAASSMRRPARPEPQVMLGSR